jgi:hypothetical protein
MSESYAKKEEKANKERQKDRITIDHVNQITISLH